mmetsp:Transcript_115341/g.274151  ORF Transcript_115341/g.274151 Transcript_115341/m.274151 type:complete len:247 (+) Transcript_115341:95-835(+)
MFSSAVARDRSSEEMHFPERESSPEDLRQQLVVQNTFLDLSGGVSAMERFTQLRRVRSDPTLAVESEGDGETTEEAPASEVPEIVERLASLASEEQEAHVPEPRGRTTVCLRNVPNNYTRQMFVELLEKQGLSGHFDFLYLPCDFHRHANLGYAFINLVNEAGVLKFWDIFHGFTAWTLPTAKVGQVSFSGPHQGLRAHIDRYRNSPVMHKSVPEEYKPLLFKSGTPQPFPPPTRKVKRPAPAKRR